MDNARQQIVDSIKANSNILVTVSTDPTVDELSAALGLTILLDKLDKRATAVFSGTIPSAINFLEPDKTFENTADSLRDFIIALDKEKADHLRYKVDGDVVKIFITPYKTTLTQNDLDFSQGEFNVELVIAVGVKDQDHLDKALAAHGKILHDASVVTVTVGDAASTLGSTDWHEGSASSLSELMVSLADGLKDNKPVLDEQIATAFLTGIVSATDRFSNDRTSSRVMTMAAQLMAAGANQQLIAAKLEEAHDIAPSATSAPSEKSEKLEEKSKKDNATELSIDRSEKSKDESKDDSAREESEASAQKELEESLAGLTGLATPTLADIESQLKDTPEPEEPASPELTAVSDSTMPGFEAPEPVVVAPAEETQEPEVAEEVPKEESVSEVSQQDETQPAEPTLPPLPDPVEAPEVPTLEPPVLDFPPAPELPPQPSEAPAEPVAPAIINEHGSFTSEPPTQQQPINSMVNEPSDAPALDMFGQPQAEEATPSVAPTIAPPIEFATEPLAPAQPGEGTPEGVAALGGTAEPVSEPQSAAESSVPVFPPLPPLPPIPTDGSLPPLPPPPPLPDFNQPVAPLSGAVSGDVFGDTPVAPLEDTSAPAPAPVEPGQYRIPGQN